MEGVAGTSIACVHCGRKYRWKPEMAGKKAKCACGHVLDVPASAPVSAPASARSSAPAAAASPGSVRPAPPPPRRTPATAPHAAPPAAPRPAPAAEPSFDDVFAVAGEEEDAASPSGAAPAAAPPPADARLSPDLQSALALRGLPPELLRRRRDLAEAELKASREQMESLAEGNVLRDIVVPVLLIAIGIGLLFGQAMVWNKRPADNIAEAAVSVATRAALAVGLMLGGIWLATAVMEVSLIGSFARNILKLSSIALAPAALYDIAQFFLGGDFGGPALGAFASIVVYAALFFLLMRMDARDTAICTMVSFILVAGANYAAWRMEGFRRGSDI
jgi:hypothetical protein